ncbi:heart- and neural crest derivatives-expressed protein 1 [Nothoprocta perdicaria]|uniref:Heart- and neural crest derivatives-expressed protein 1 n=3 Tax=Nothoprocta TaxID=8806 RepID=A0A8C6Z476_NOTPE|nr:heart- and neural crest derivatives-expressed protein 1 [Nothoprocta perdicaria]
MNLVGGYQQHHPAVLHEPFLLGRCHQERGYFPGWVLGPAEAAPAHGPGYGAAEFGPAGPARLEALGGRLGRRRGSAGPKKERRRTESINSAFAELRECIPNVPADTKLSKIKTLRLATSYIAYLMEVLAKDSQPGDTEGFKAELKKADGRENKRKREPQPDVYSQPLGHGEKKLKGRTGWPQQVWALELNP